MIENWLYAWYYYSENMEMYSIIFVDKERKLQMKKLAALLLLAALVISVPVWAAENSAPPQPVSVDGYIYDMTETGITVADGEERAEIMIMPETFIVDAGTGLPLALADRESDRVIVYYVQVQGQNSAVLILGNVPETGMLPQFGRVEAVELGDDEAVVTVQGGSLLVTISRDSQIEPFMTREYVTIDQIEAGADLLMWYPFVALSYPAQATAQRTIILSRGPAPQEQYDGYENGYANGYTNGYNGNNDYQMPSTDYTYTPAPVMSLADALGLVYSDFYTENNVTMVPLRQVAEAMGFNVTWNESDRSITLAHSDGQAFGTVVLGQYSFEGRNLEVAPTIRNDRTFVPVAFFEILLGM
jgi:hypothetical protein